ncbi:MAG: hypothetical protein KDA57_08035 [Planctomycetales bacterium]|nr:hypothetical protein [Planctomycetales bacterium]
MLPTAAFLLAITTGYAIAFGYGVAVRVIRHLLLAATAVISILMCPLIIPADQVILRALTSLYAADLVFKVVELRRLATTNHFLLQASNICRYLIPFPFLLVVYQERQSLLPFSDKNHKRITRLFGACLITLFAIGLFVGAYSFPYATSNFLLDHTVKVLVFVIFLEAFSRCLYHLERLAGYDTTPIINSLLQSHTVSEFWQRYNVRVHSWFYLNLFQPSRRASTTYAVVLVFGVNGLLHELMFGITTSRFDGYQLMFFLVQIPAVLASRWLRRLAARNSYLKTMVHSATILWMLLTTMLFFHGVNRIVPFYSATPWLP